MALAERLHTRRTEIEQAILFHVWAIVGDREADEGIYPYGLQRLVRKAVGCGYEVLEGPAEEDYATPTRLLKSARKAARRDIPLDVILRGYLAGQALFADYVIEEAGRDQPSEAPDLHLVLRNLSLRAARLIDEVSTAYAQEQQRSSMSSRDRLAANVDRLLSGSSLDTSAVNYDFGLVHTGFVGIGEGAEDALRRLARGGGHRLLVVLRPDNGVWAWIGSAFPLSLDGLRIELASRDVGRAGLACGESLAGIDGWRLTHQQARLALPFALRDTGGPVHYADVALSAAMLRDKVLFSSVQRRYLTALEEETGGVVLRETLRAYWAANRNVSSAAAALGVNRHTVTRRIRGIEERFGRPLHRCEGEVEAALKLEELGLELEP